MNDDNVITENTVPQKKGGKKKKKRSLWARAANLYSLYQ